jgi:hypothetical protein
MTRLNIPYIVTIVVDYAWMASSWAFAYMVASNEKWNPYSAAACVAYAILVNVTREQVYSITLRKHFAKYKTDFKMADHPEYWTDIATTSLYIVAIGFLGARLGIMNARFDQENLWSTILAISADYWLVNIIKDNVSMRYVHPWMHKRENYWIHKRHHLGNKDLSVFPGTFVFDMLDLTLEFGVGPILGMMVKHYLLGMDPSLHILSFVCSIWTDGNVHSMNPYSQAVGNPIVDWFMKLTVVHNLHHAIQKDPKYMTVFPMHQLFSPASFKEDIELYNKTMKTNIHFEILLDD